MEYRLVVLPSAATEMARLSKGLRAALLDRMEWLRRNADAIVHYRLHNMPDDLAGLCRIRHGDYRILYWVSSTERTIHIYRVRHRTKVYRDF